MAVYPSSTKEEKIPTVEGDVDIKEIRIEEKDGKKVRVAVKCGTVLA